VILYGREAIRFLGSALRDYWRFLHHVRSRGRRLPKEDFFPDIDNLFGNMSLTDDNTNGGSASAPAPTLYVFLIFTCVLQFLGLTIDLDMLDMLCSYRSLVNVVCLISMFSAIFSSLFSWIKSSGKLLIFPTIQKPYAFHMQFSPVGYAVSLKPLVF
jgi:hypothetical protein